jgi:hypothetical protein
MVMIFPSSSVVVARAAPGTGSIVANPGILEVVT